MRTWRHKILAAGATNRDIPAPQLTVTWLIFLLNLETRYAIAE